MSSFIKITSFDGANTDFSERVEEYLDDVETAALQNLERDGYAWHWSYYVLSEASKKDYGSIVKEYRDRYGVKASEASSLFAVQNEMLSLQQREAEHISEHLHRVEKLSRKVPKVMDSLFAIAFIQGMQDQERK
ncbi:hypothetical protein HOY82DRAFT_602671 [Tuber indicum]|nr:hypothetical protein HOY82DRAFT_602671 [Tuber indicum]